MKKVLITGGAGYIGSELTGHFLRDGYQVTCLDSLMYDSTSLLRYTVDSKFNFEKGDVRDTSFMNKHMKEADIIIPLAALVGFPLCERDPRGAREINYEVNQWIADNKSATVFGPGSRMRTDLLVNNFVLRALRDRALVLYECEFMRNYLHIQDACRSFKFVVDNWDSCKNETYNVGNDSINMNKLQLAQKIKHHIPLEIIKAEINTDPDVRDYEVSSEKIYKKGFNCEYSLDDGIKQLIKAYGIIESPWFANY